MTRRDRLELLLAYHAGVLEEPDTGKVRALLETGDPGTVGASAEALEVLARLAETATPVEPAADVKSKLMAGLASGRAAAITPADATVLASRAGRLPAAAAGSGRRASTVWRALGIAAAVAIASGVTYIAVRSDRQTLQSRAASAESTAAAQARRLTELERALAAAEAGNVQAQAALTAMYSSDARFGILNPAAGDTDQRRGRVIVDPARRQVQVYVFDLVPPPPGRTYQLWLLPEGGGAPIPAPIFQVDAAGKAFLTTPLPAGVSSVAGAAISEEAAGGSTTGTPDQVKLLGKAG